MSNSNFLFVKIIGFFHSVCIMQLDKLIRVNIIINPPKMIFFGKNSIISLTDQITFKSRDLKVILRENHV